MSRVNRDRGFESHPLRYIALRTARTAGLLSRVIDEPVCARAADDRRTVCPSLRIRPASQANPDGTCLLCLGPVDDPRAKGGACRLPRAMALRLLAISPWLARPMVLIWHGEQDRNDPVVMARAPERRLRHVRAVYYPDAVT